MKNNIVCEIVEGTRANPGKVVKTFTSDQAYKCGGPNTACLRAFATMKDSGRQVFFRSV